MSRLSMTAATALRAIHSMRIVRQLIPRYEAGIEPEAGMVTEVTPEGDCSSNFHGTDAMMSSAYSPTATVAPAKKAFGVVPFTPRVMPEIVLVPGTLLV